MLNLKYRWTRFWIRRGGASGLGKLSTRLATLFVPPYKGRSHLARLAPQGYISPKAELHHDDLELGNNIFIGDRVQIFKTANGGVVRIKSGAALYSDITIETADNGTVTIGEETHIQPRCQLVAGKASILIGKRVEIAPGCALYPFNHGFSLNKRIREQPLVSRGDIVIGDDVWLGFGVIILDGVHIGEGAVIGAGSVVTHDIPENAVAVGNPARVVKMRADPVA
jgi:acetyltransferase-like isoleucine patch superfamily enzyme